MKIQHEKNIGIATYFLIGGYLVWFFFYNLKEKMYKNKEEGKLKRIIPKMQNLFSTAVATFVICSINFLDTIIAKKTFFCQEGLILLYIYCFIIIGWLLSKVYLETKTEHESFIDNLIINFLCAFIFSEYVYYNII
jgi:hypothetical protein